MSAATLKPRRKTAALKKTVRRPDLAADFARGRDHAIKMMEEAVAIGHEREPWRDLRNGEAQDNLVEGYLRDVIEDPSLRHGFTSILSAAIQNDTVLERLATITLAETQAGEIGADGTERFQSDSWAPKVAPDEQLPEGGMDEAARIVGQCIDLMEHILNNINSDAAYGANTLLRKAETEIRAAIKGRTYELQEEASGAMCEALAVLQVVAHKLDREVLQGVITLTELAKDKFDATLGRLEVQA